MTLATFSTSKEAQQAAALLEGYRFELGNHDAPQWVSLWIEFYQPAWVRDAVIEALYQGRYKAFSVRQILELWQKRGKPIRHTTHDFESAVCEAYGGAKLTKINTAKLANTNQAVRQSKAQRKPARQRASLRTHQSLSAISFNLAEQPPFHQPVSEQPVSKPLSVQQSAKEQPVNGQQHREQQQRPFIPAGGNNWSSRRVLIETAETLQAQSQVNGSRYASARAIQPFKPALPFSAQTLRLAKQKAMAEAR
ncbi:MAG: hypothetical protein AAFR25_03160 [Cyanobacteria bacterium J06629_19]